MIKQIDFFGDKQMFLKWLSVKFNIFRDLTSCHPRTWNLSQVAQVAFREAPKKGIIVIVTNVNKILPAIPRTLTEI